jgi:hypothetical protein
MNGTVRVKSCASLRTVSWTLCVAALLASVMAVGLPHAAAAQQEQPDRLVFAVLPGIGYGDAELGVFPLLTARAAYRYQPDFSVYAEVSQASTAGSAPDGCFIALCSDYFRGRRRLRAWHLGMETRLAGYQPTDRHRIMVNAGIGQRQLADPETTTGVAPFAMALVSVQGGASLEMKFRNNFGARAAVSAYVSQLEGADKYLKGMWEMVALHMGVTYTR